MMNKAPMLYEMDAVARKIAGGEWPSTINKDGTRWFPARPLGLYSFVWRCQLAWKVFTGKADAVTWPDGQ